MDPSPGNSFLAVSSEIFTLFDHIHQCQKRQKGDNEKVMRNFKAVLFTILVFGATYPCGAVIPDPYYVNVSWDDHTVKGIETLLGDGFTIPYQADVFDCSERSAYVEWLLQCHGFDAGFCVDGSGPWVVADGEGYNVHMWVTAALYNDTTGVFEGRVYIEASCDPMTIIRFGDPDWSKYNREQDPEFLGMKNYRSLPDMLAGITPSTGDDNSILFGEDEVDWWQFGSDLIKKPAPYKRITEQDIINLREQVSAMPSRTGHTFKTTAPEKKYGTFRTV
jgi:hypothetical protein